MYVGRLLVFENFMPDCWYLVYTFLLPFFHARILTDTIIITIITTSLVIGRISPVPLMGSQSWNPPSNSCHRQLKPIGEDFRKYFRFFKKYHKKKLFRICLTISQHNIFFQSCGSGFIEYGYGSGSSISSESGFSFWWPKTVGKNTTENFVKSFFDQKMQFTYP